MRDTAQVRVQVEFQLVRVSVPSTHLSQPAEAVLWDFPTLVEPLLVAAWLSGRWLEERETETRNARRVSEEGIPGDSSVTTARTPGEGQEYQGTQDQEY